MPGDKVLSQAEIDALVSKVPTKPVSPPVTKDMEPKDAGPKDVAPASTPSSSSSASPSAKSEYDTLPARLARLESNYAIVKKELQAILLDLREKYLEAENPFKVSDVPSHPPADTRQTETHGE